MHRRYNDEGFTLVEMLVSLVLLALVLSSFLGVTLSAVASNRLAEGRTTANQVLAEQLELLQATKWSRAGLRSGDCGFPGASDVGQDTVQLNDARQPGDPYPQFGGACAASAGQAAVVRGGITYTVVQHITWNDDAADGTGAADTDYDGTHDEKRFLVMVSWTQPGKARTVTATALRAPTTSEVTPRSPKAVGFVLSASATGHQTLDTANALTAPVVLTVQTSAAATAVTVTYATRLLVSLPPVALVPDALGTTWTATLPIGTCCFNAGSEIFTFRGSTPLTTASATASVALRSSTALFTMTGSAAPTTVGLDSNNLLTAAVTLNVTTSIAVGTVYATFVRNGVSVDQNLTPDSSYKSWTTTLPLGSGPFAAGSLALTLTASTSSGDNSVGRSVTLTPYLAPISVTSVVLGRADGTDATAGGVCVSDPGNSRKYQMSSTRLLTATFANKISSDLVSLLWNNGPAASAEPTPTVAGPDSSGATTYTWTYPLYAKYGFSPGSTTPTVTVTRSDGTSATFTPAPTYNVADSASC